MLGCSVPLSSKCNIIFSKPLLCHHFFTLPSKIPRSWYASKMTDATKWLTILRENYYKYIERRAIHFIFYLLLPIGYNTSAYDMIGYFQGQSKYSLPNMFHFFFFQFHCFNKKMMYILENKYTSGNNSFRNVLLWDSK